MTELRSNQVKAVQVLASGGSVQEAAQAADVAERTVYEWRQNHIGFRARLTEMTDAVFFDGVMVMSALIRDAATVLQSVMNDPKAADRDRVSAARAALSSALQIREQYALQQRLEAIEAQLAQIGADNV